MSSMSNEESSQSSVLIVTTQRDDRRVLFDTLDAQNFEAVYTAKDLPQALSFLQQDPQIDVVVIEFLGDASEAVAFCAQKAPCGCQRTNSDRQEGHQ